MSKHTHINIRRRRQSGRHNACGQAANCTSFTCVNTHTQRAAAAGKLSLHNWRLGPGSANGRGQPLDRFPIPDQTLKQETVQDNPPVLFLLLLSIPSLFLLLPSPFCHPFPQSLPLLVFHVLFFSFFIFPLQFNYVFCCNFLWCHDDFSSPPPPRFSFIRMFAELWSWCFCVTSSCCWVTSSS